MFVCCLLLAKAQTLQLTPITSENFCASGKDTVRFSLNYSNIPAGSNIVFYQSTNPNFNPYLGQGDSIGFINIGSNTNQTGNQIITDCPHIVGIFIDACNDNGRSEPANEYILITSGKGFLVNNLKIDLPANKDINLGSNPCTFGTPSAALMTLLRIGTCNSTNLIPASPGDSIPPNALVVIFTGNGTDQPYDFSDLCNTGQDVYILQNNCTLPINSGSFANNGPVQPCSQNLRTTIIYNRSCMDILSYDRCGLSVFDNANPNAGDGNYVIHLDNTDISTVGNGGILNNNANKCNGVEIDSIVGSQIIKYAIPNDGSNNGGTASNFCNDGLHYIKAITNPKASQPISNAIQFNLTCLDIATNVNSLSICSGSNAAITISSSDPNATFSWVVSGGNSITGATAGSGNTINQVLTYSGNTKDSITYIITAKDGNCTVTKNVKVVVSKCSTCTINFDFGAESTIICVGKTISLDASTAYDSYIWSTGAITHDITITQPGKYWVEVTKNNCKGADTILVLQVDKPLKPNIGRDTSFCGAFALNLSVSNPNNNTVEWFRNQTLVGTANTFVANQAGTYIVKVSNGCGSVADTMVITSSGSLTLNLGNDTTLCNGKTIQLNASVSGNNITYQWSTGEQTPSILVSQFDRYDVIVSNGNCTVFDTILVDFINQPTINHLGNDTMICGDFLMQLFTGDANTHWNTNANGPQIQVTKGGTYIAENKNQCGQISDTIVITQFTKPSVNIGSDTTFCDSIQLTVGNGNFTTIRWSTGDSLRSIMVTNSGLFSVKVSNTNCLTVDSISLNKACLYEVYIPTAFTPNGDGSNDYIAPLSFRKEVEILQFLVYNRWGELVYEQSNFTPNSLYHGWDGSFKGAPAQMDTYVYIYKAKLPDNTIKSYNGVFTLMR